MEAWVGYGLLFISLAVFCASLGFLIFSPSALRS